MSSHGPLKRNLAIKAIVAELPEAKKPSVSTTMLTKENISRFNAKKTQLKPPLKSKYFSQEMVKSIVRNNNEVQIYLDDKHNNKETYQKLTCILLYKYQTCAEFQKCFKRPTINENGIFLHLKDEHTYTDNQEILYAVHRFFAHTPIDTLQVNTALVSRNLINHLELKSNHVTLHFAGDYKEPYNQFSINRFFHELYEGSAGFRAVFNKPETCMYNRNLTLKKGQHFKNGDEVYQTLIKITDQFNRSQHNTKEKDVISYTPAFANTGKPINISHIKPPTISFFIKGTKKI